MRINSSFVDSNRFAVLLFSALFFIGLGYVSLLPVFEGFDELAHYSRIREIEASSSSVFNNESFIDQLIVNYSGPMAYTSNSPPYSHENTYDNYFTKKIIIDGYSAKYRNNPFDKKFQPSSQINWEMQHPPLYYFLFAKLGFFTYKLPLVSQVFILRVTSYLLALIGVFLGFIGISSMKNHINESETTNMKLGFLIYPLIFPMFFLEFARIGNDSLCIFFVGLLVYSIAGWQSCKNSIIRTFSIGFFLSLGLITKALFIPITASVGLFVFLNLLSQNIRENTSSLYKSFFFISIPLILIGGGWYLFRYFMVGDPGLGAESFQLSQQGGLINGLKEHFDFVNFMRGLIVPFVTFIWAGSWSLVRLPLVSYIPLFILAAWIMKIYISLAKDYKIDNITNLSALSFLLMYLGLAWHVIINMGLNGIATSPGWYMHILMPLLAPIVGLASSTIIKSSFKSKLFIFLLIYSFIFQLSAIVLHACLFGGGATKGNNKSFLFNQNILTLESISNIYHNLKIISFPNLSFVSFVTGFSLLSFLVIKSMLIKNAQDSIGHRLKTGGLS